MWNLKHSAKYVCRTGKSASSTARAGTSCEMERRRTRNSSSTLLTSFRFPITTSRKGDPIDLGRSEEICGEMDIELISKKHCLPCETSRTKRIKLITKIGKALPHLGGTGKIPGGILHLSITATMDPALIDRGNLIDGDWANYSGNDSQH